MLVTELGMDTLANELLYIDQSLILVKELELALEMGHSQVALFPTSLYQMQ